MSAHLDWEKTLRETHHDLSEERWQKLENDMRAWLASEARRKEAAPLSWRERVWAGFRRWGLAAGTGVAFASLAFTLWLRPTPVVAHASRGFVWATGQILDVPGPAEWDWSDARTRIVADGARMVLSEHKDGSVAIRLDRGRATFHVDHRKPDESFAVDAGECRVRVVGTVFTVGKDSASSWVEVEEGRIRYERGAYSRLVDAGRKAICREPGLAAAQDSVSAPAPSAAQAPAQIRPAVAPAAPEVVVPSCTEGADCIARLSAFVREHPQHPAASEVALRWARLSARTGDSRDALVAYAIAAQSPAQSGISRLEALKLRSRLSQDKAVADSLDAWLPSLTSGSALWRGAWTLRGEVARRTGDAAGAAKADQILSDGASASGGR